MRDFFDTIPHSDLLKSVARRIVDRHVLQLIKLWLKAPVEERDDDGKRRMSGGKSSARRHASGRGRQPNALRDLYLAHARTRKSFGLMTRKLSETESQHSSQFWGTLSRRNVSVASANSRYVG